MTQTLKRAFATKFLVSLSEAAFMEVLAKVIEHSKLIVGMREEQEQLDPAFRGAVEAETNKMLQSMVITEIAYLIRRDLANSTQETEDSYTDLSIEEVLFDILEKLIMSDLEPLISELQESGEIVPNFFVCFEPTSESTSIFDPDEHGEDEDDEDEEDAQNFFNENVDEYIDESLRTLGEDIWREVDLCRDYVVEVRGTKAQTFKIEGCREQLIAPCILALLKKIRTAPVDTWIEHLPGWEFRLIKR